LLKERKELSALGKLEKAPAWLNPVWVNQEPVFILCKTQAQTQTEGEIYAPIR